MSLLYMSMISLIYCLQTCNYLFTKYKSALSMVDSINHHLSNLHHIFVNALDDKKNTMTVFCDKNIAFDKV